MKMLGMVLFLILLSIALASPGKCQGHNCPIGEPCVSDLGCSQLYCNLRCVGVEKLVGPKYCVLTAPEEE